MKELINQSIQNIGQSQLVQTAIEEVKAEVQRLCVGSGVSTQGFEIDHCYCDWGDVPTSSAVEIIDNAARKLGVYGSENYKSTVNYICEQVTDFFKN
ncbi:hypothetical protein D6U78_10180 [Vibrio cholerae]|uniref:Uncharacterized protein n=1 Tax=Vibrio cholerae TaxID=666 RepID=A0ABD7STL8_VIBCL|nr:hypothetical protein [Vibrio cholerae]MVF55257.1 hypothetical protein [Vibrio cholerae]TXX67271.1 hypothetical protein FXF03_01475 [Vibrio cholerae]GIA99315.1 hypothetical protein VCSRO136_2307 [Vibrio cholerae]HAS7807764.1 hypothetical protein [Vibrio cholerae]HBN6882829.1 hypothetical protein [Vibrio cholerae]